MPEGVVEGKRVAYVVEKQIVDRGEAMVVCARVLQVLRPRLVEAIVDAYTDHPDDRLYPAMRGRWLRIRGVKTVSQVTPQWRSSRSR
jgi:hypothetical protein